MSELGHEVLSIELAPYFYCLTFRRVSATARPPLPLEWPVFQQRNPRRRSSLALAVAQRQSFELHNSLLDPCSFLLQLSKYLPEVHLGKCDTNLAALHQRQPRSWSDDRVRAGQVRSSAYSARSQMRQPVLLSPPVFDEAPSEDSEAGG